MKKFLPAYLILFGLLIAACSGGATAQKDAGKQLPANVKELVKELDQIIGNAKGRIGVSALRMETNEEIAFRGDEHFPMQSVYKLPISMAVLKQIDDGKLTLEQKVRVEKKDFVRPGQRSPIRDKYPNGTEVTLKELMELAVSESDGTASDVLMDLAGGPAAIESYLKETGIGDISIANSEKEFAQDWQTQYKNWATPKAAVALLRALHEGCGISPAHRELLLKFMIGSPTGPKRLKGLLPAGTVVAHKTGTSGSRDGITAATNDIGIITLPNGKHFVIAVFVGDSPADEKTREETIARIAKAVWDKWNK